MRTVYKCRVRCADAESHGVTIPRDSRILHVAGQNGAVTIWFECDSDAPTQVRYFAYYGTGWGIPEDAEYVGTAMITGFVWHVYEHMTKVEEIGL